MPNYRGPLGHRNQTAILSVVLLAVPVLTRNLDDLAIAAGSLLGLWMHPDWDINNRKFDWLAKLMFVDEYAMLVPHRHRISHTLVLGTLIRFGITWCIPRLIILVLFPKIRFTAWTFRVILGLCLADALHIAADRLQTWTKRRTRKIRPRRTVWKSKRPRSL